jgi:hypothetical protein
MKQSKPIQYEPKRKNRFIVEFPKEFELEPWLVNNIDRPKYVNYKWEEMEVTFKDPICNSSSEALFKLIKFVETFKDHQVSPLFLFYITMLDPTGVAVEKWEIAVEELISINFGDLDYGSDECQEPKMIIKPAYCTYII